MNWGFLLVAIVFNVAGNLLMKKFAVDSSVKGVLGYASPIFLLGAIFFGVNLLFYAKAVQSIPLVVAYPVLVGTSIFLVTLVATRVFDERVTPVMMVGMILISVGLALLVRSSG